MSEARKPAGWPIAVALVLALVLLPMLYVLSVGPALWLVSKDCISVEHYQTAYGPLFYLYENFEWVKVSLRWYAGFWINL